MAEDIEVLTAVDARAYLAELEAERTAARSSGVAEIDAYARDLDSEIEFWRRQYVIAAVTEIATLHAEIHGPAIG